MKALFTCILLLPVLIYAQGSDVFVVKKSAEYSIKFHPGFYCSDYMTDSRFCFYFDSIGIAHFFTSTKKPSEISADYYKWPGVGYSGNYKIKGDSLSFVSSVPVVKEGAELNKRSMLTTTGKGILGAGNTINLTLISDIDGGPATVKRIMLYKAN